MKPLLGSYKVKAGECFFFFFCVVLTCSYIGLHRCLEVFGIGGHQLKGFRHFTTFSFTLQLLLHVNCMCSISMIFLPTRLILFVFFVLQHFETRSRLLWLRLSEAGGTSSEAVEMVCGRKRSK